MGGGATVGIDLGADLVDTDGDGKIHIDEFLDNIQRGLLARSIWAAKSGCRPPRIWRFCSSATNSLRRGSRLSIFC